MDLAVRHLAEHQDGLFTTEQALLVGSSLRSLRHALATKEVLRLTRGLYVLADQVPSTEEERHLQRARGALLLVPDAVLSHWTALLAHGIPVITVPHEVRLLRPVSPKVRRKGQVRRAGIVIDAGAHDAQARSARMRSPYGPTVPIATALLQHAKSRGVEEGLASADAAVRAALVPRRGLVDEAAADRGPFSRRGTQVASLADGRIESVGESRLRFVCLTGGIEVEPQVTIRDEGGSFVARVDFLVKGTNVVLEFDGRMKYAEANGRALWDEKRREDRLRALGYVVVRVIWADLADPMTVVGRIRDAMVPGRQPVAT